MSVLPKRVVITGLSVVTPLGGTVASTFANLLEKKNGIRRLTAADMEFMEELIVKSGGPLDSWDKETWIKKAGVVKSVYHALGVNTCWDALADAKWQPENEEQYTRTGIMYGSSRTSSPDISIAHREVVKHGYSRLDRIILTKLIPSMIVGSVTIPHHICGFANSIVSGNSTGINAIGDAYRTVGFGEADVMMAGSAEHEFDALVLDSLSKGNYGLNLSVDEKPESASRPFDLNRKGWVYSLGAGCVVLEELEHALKRNAHIYAEVSGYSMVSEGGSETAKQGTGMYRAMNRAVKQNQVDVVFADASGNGDWDEGEANAISKKFGKNVWTTAVKGSLGHMNSASSSVNVALAAYAVHKGIIPPIRNLDSPLNIPCKFATSTVKTPLRGALVNSCNYDGTAFGSILLKHYEK